MEATALVMSHCGLAITQCPIALLFLFTYAGSVYSQVHYYITPSLYLLDYPQDSHLTLAQFAADPLRYLSNATNISLSFLPGNRSLNREFILSQLDNFSMTNDGESNGITYVECDGQSGRFIISKMKFATVRIYISLAVEIMKLAKWSSL